MGNTVKLMFPTLFDRSMRQDLNLQSLRCECDAGKNRYDAADKVHRDNHYIFCGGSRCAGK